MTDVRALRGIPMIRGTGAVGGPEQTLRLAWYTANTIFYRPLVKVKKKKFANMWIGRITRVILGLRAPNLRTAMLCWHTKGQVCIFILQYDDRVGVFLEHFLASKYLIELGIV